jgi:hypothetical protein
VRCRAAVVIVAVGSDDSIGCLAYLFRLLIADRGIVVRLRDDDIYLTVTYTRRVTLSKRGVDAAFCTQSHQLTRDPG